MQTVEVSGRFVDDTGAPVVGSLVKFVPSKIWVEDKDGNTYPAYAPEVILDSQGNFCVELSRTDTADFMWHYTVFCPVGKWTVYINEEGPLRLRDLLPKRFARDSNS